MASCKGFHASGRGELICFFVLSRMRRLSLFIAQPPEQSSLHWPVVPTSNEGPATIPKGVDVLAKAVNDTLGPHDTLFLSHKE